MASEKLLEVLNPYGEAGSAPFLASECPARSKYVASLANQSSASLDTTEPHALANSLQSILLSLQAIGKRSHRFIIDSTVRHSALSLSLPAFDRAATDLRTAIPNVDREALSFSATYSKTGENDHLLERQQSLWLLRNLERLLNILELPTLMASTANSVPPNYSSALDLNGHVRRLNALYPDSPVVTLLFRQADEVILQLTADLIGTLKSPGLKLATALRTVGSLRRVLSDQNQVSKASCGTEERVPSVLFLRCRHAALSATLAALEPLRKLAEEEKASGKAARDTQVLSRGHQTERYLKRYVEIFREQSFHIISMFRNLFPASVPSDEEQSDDALEPLHSSCSILSSFMRCLLDMLLGTLREFLPAIKDHSARDSILTQVLYCSSSLARLGGEFGILLAGFDIDNCGFTTHADDMEWVGIIKRHRLLTVRLDLMLGDYRGVIRDV